MLQQLVEFRPLRAREPFPFGNELLLSKEVESEVTVCNRSVVCFHTLSPFRVSDYEASKGMYLFPLALQS